MILYKRKKLKSVAIIDSLEGWKRSSKYYPDLLVTDNILLYDKILSINPKEKIINSDKVITEKDINKWGKLFIDLGLLIDKELNGADNKYKNKITGCIQEVGSLLKFILALICKIMGLIRSIDLENVEKVILIYSNDDQWQTSPKHSRFISSYPALIKEGFFGKINVILDEIKVNYKVNVNKTETDNFLLKFFSNKILINLIWKLINNKYFNYYKAITVIKGDSEIIRENITNLFISRIMPVTYNNVIKNYSYNCNIEKKDTFLVNRKVINILKTKLKKNFKFNNHQINSITKVIEDYLERNLNLVIRQTYEIDYFFKKIKEKYNKVSSIIVSSPNGSIAKYFHKIAKINKIKIINFEHGMTAGIKMRNKYFMKFSEATNCDYMFVTNRLALTEYKLSINTSIAKLFVIGIPAQVKNIKSRAFQNFILRKELRLKSTDFCICHVSNLVFNGAIRYGPGTPTDKHVNDFNNKILKEVYCKINNKKIIFKDYPSVRHFYQPKLQNRTNIKNKNIIFQEEGDWRYLRSISNLIITNATTSTLSWHIGSKTPIVFLDSPLAKLRHNWLSESFKKSFFYFDLSNPNWTLDLKKLLVKTPEEINKMWIEKKEYRDEFINNYLFPNEKTILPYKEIKKIIS